jgi:hypothetical protein
MGDVKMKSVVGLLAASLLATSLIPLNASGASLLGGLVKTGDDSGNSNQVISVGSSDGGTSIGLLGSEGVSVNLDGGSVPIVGDLLGGDGSNGGSVPVVGGLLGDSNSGLPVVGDLLGGNGVTLPVDLGDVDIGVPGLAGVSTSPAQGGGTSVGIELLGGGGGSVSSNPLGLLGNGGINVSLPGLGGISGDNDNGGGGSGGGGNGGSGGGSGGSGGNGGGGSGGVGTIVKYFSNDSGSGFVIPQGISSRLKALLRILAERDYLRISNGRAVCLNSFGVAEVGGWVPQKDWGALQKALATYSQDIYTLRQLLANCRSNAQRQALNLTQLNRVIAIDIGNDGRPVLFML